MKKYIVVICFMMATGYASGQHKLNDTLIKQLIAIGEEDQRYRNQLDPLTKKYASDSLELERQLQSVQKLMRKTDSLNTIKITGIIDKYGWLGPDEVGDEANRTLFLVIQHADLTIQKKYLPVMREAVLNKKAKAASFALLEDRVAIREGRKQVYGSQLSWNMQKNTFTILPLEDPVNVDKRRAAVGLGPLAIYLKDCCDITWDVEKYLKEH